MVRRTDRPLRIVRVSFERTRFSAEHLIDAYACLVSSPPLHYHRLDLRRPGLAARRRSPCPPHRWHSTRAYQVMRKRVHTRSTVKS